jgi:Mg-chelatase subunit ChlI
MMRTCQIVGCVAALLLAGTALPAPAQSTADAYFHEAAQQYVADNVQAARRAVEQGLEVAPTDSRLLALRKKLRQGSKPTNDPQSGRDSTSSGSSPQSQQKSNESSTGGNQSSSEQRGASQPGDRDSPSKQSGPRASEQRPSDRAGRADTMRRGRGGRPVDTLSRAQAERLLRALEGQERRLLRRLQTRSSKRRTVEKDW